MVAKVHEDYLTRHGAKETKHSGRSLYDHLKGTHDLLRDWGNPEHVCLAGLFHSVYGTGVFKHQSVDFKERPTVRALIGREAEYLVYLFAVTDRPRVFLDERAISSHPPFSDTAFWRHLFDNHTHQAISVLKQTRDELVEIETANLLDQGTDVETLRKLSQVGHISGMARAAVELAR